MSKITLVGVMAPNSSAFKPVSSKIEKAGFVETDFYPTEEDSNHFFADRVKKKKGFKAPKANEAATEETEHPVSGAISSEKYIDISEKKDTQLKATHLAFSDGSVYTVGVGFSKEASEENKEWVKEQIKKGK